ncbi:MAG: aldehyde dehydrogenase family protein [Chloroflexota bacterium]
MASVPNSTYHLPFNHYPRGLLNKLLFLNDKGEIWFKPNVTEEQIRAGVARPYQEKQQGKTTLVLGAGNIGTLIPGDFLYKLFIERQVVVVKMNPVNEYLGPLLEEGYAPLIDAGYLRIVYGGVDVAQYLIRHELVDELHITGSDSTYEAIVFGTGEAGQLRKQQGERIVTKRFTSELGNVTPVIIYPDGWSQADIERVADAIVAQHAGNAGHYCLTARLVVMQENWEHRDAFIDAMDKAYRRLPDRKSYYPRVEERHDEFLAHYPDARQYGNGNLPWTFAVDVDSTDVDAPAFKLETFCGVLSEVGLSGQSPEAFLRHAVEFVNDHVWGTLTASLIVPTDYETHDVVEQAIADLRYGSVILNGFGANGYGAVPLTWGGHSGSTPQDIQSGIGVVNNVLMFDEDHIQKSVLRLPFKSLKSQIDFEKEQGLVNLLAPLSHTIMQPTPKHIGRVMWQFIQMATGRNN